MNDTANIVNMNNNKNNYVLPLLKQHTYRSNLMHRLRIGN